MKRITLFTLCLLLIQVVPLFAQNSQIDSLLLKIEHNTNNDSLKSYQLTKLSNFLQVEDLDRAIYYAGQSITIAEDLPYKSLHAEALSQQASNYVWKNNYDSALQLFFQAVDVVKKNKLQKQLSYIYDGIADLYTETGSLDQALKFSRMALDISQQEKDNKQAMFAYHSISAVYKGLRNFGEAERYTRLALDLFKKYKDPDRVATCYMDIGRLYIATGRDAEARRMLDTATLIFSDLSEPIQIAEANELYAELDMTEGNLEQAAAHLQQSLSVYERNGLEEDKYRVYMAMANNSFLQKKYAGARKLLDAAMRYFKTSDAVELQLNALLYLAKTDSALGLNTQAYEYLKNYQHLSEEVNRRKQEQQAHQMLMEYELVNKEKENQRLREQNIDANNRQLLFTVAGVFLFLALAVTLAMYYQKQKMNRRLAETTQRTEQINKELEQSNHVKNQLFSILAHDLRSPMSNTLHMLKLTKRGEVTFEQFRQMADLLEDDLVHNNELLDNMLNWAKSQMEGIVLHKKKIGLKYIVEENTHLFQSIAGRKHISFCEEIPETIEVTADENILRLALRNAISNAVKFSLPYGLIHITAKERDGKVLVQVTDKGMGLSATQLSRLFTSQVNSTTGTHSEKGAGLGLKITKEMMDRMEAPFWLESKEGGGTTVNMLLEK
ncbi:tetratricopeptide repeat-containing sensor histidine kinase [Foetidibacter luteolus]|uniref:tetratricopeptide repeat-containing sensor histidine kinase n=1 Tax=Foetidibacter luteolus TaxID=2608880 RepID=UPI001A98FBCA|nr:tetratricopeptide repeat-containing sensor histidine kinase [Foetidibacter luteolus]